MITRAELRERFPEYDNMLAIDKICLENSLNTGAGKIRRNIERPLEVILTIGLPIATPFLAKEGYIAPDPNFARYAAATLVGFTVGKCLGMSIGTLIYEVVDKEGEINQFYQKVKNHFCKNTNSTGAI